MSLLMKVAMDADKGKWVTINGSHIHLNEKGEPDKGNPNVIKGMKKSGSEKTNTKGEKPSSSKSGTTNNSGTISVGPYKHKMPQKMFSAVNKILPFSSVRNPKWGDGKIIDIEGGHKASLSVEYLAHDEDRIELKIVNSDEYAANHLLKNLKWNPKYDKQVQDAMMPYGDKIGEALRSLGYQTSVERGSWGGSYVVINARKTGK